MVWAVAPESSRAWAEKPFMVARTTIPNRVEENRVPAFEPCAHAAGAVIAAAPAASQSRRVRDMDASLERQGGAPQ